MRAGYNPTRRNRNLGTARQGHGQDNRLVIPESWHEDRVFWEKLRDPIVVRREIYSTTLTFLVEPPREDCVHACTVDDVVDILLLLPRTDRLRVKLFILRQPTRKQEILRSCWGRVAYNAEIGPFQGVAIFLEAQNPNEPVIWPKSLDPFGQRDLERLALNGHQIRRTKRHYEIHMTTDSIRDTQLYRTLPHEVGHYVQYSADLEQGVDHWSRPHLDRERFAHRYADTFSERARREKLIPFPRQINYGRLASDGLRPSWFGA